MIDLIAIRELYKTKEIDEICWIYGEDNLVDAMTKEKCNKVLEKFIDGNEIAVRIKGSVERKKAL
ncbi:hypothetical protein F5B17DRAFT_424161, partial [Nemania serpens]